MKTLLELKQEFEKSGRYVKTNAGKHIGYGYEVKRAEDLDNE